MTELIVTCQRNDNIVQTIPTFQDEKQPFAEKFPFPSNSMPSDKQKTPHITQRI